MKALRLSAASSLDIRSVYNLSKTALKQASKYHFFKSFHCLARLSLSHNSFSSRHILLDLTNTTMKVSTVLFLAAGAYRVAASVSNANVALLFKVYRTLITCC